MRIGIYKDTLANNRGADIAVLALAEGLRERGHDAVVFKKGDFGKRMSEKWDVVVSTGTNELLDICNHVNLVNPVQRQFPVVQQFHTNPKSQFKWKRFIRNWKIRRALRHVSAIQVLREDFVSQVAKYGVPVHVIGNWSRFGQGDGGCAPEPPMGGEGNVIIYPAAFAKGKNQKLLINAFAKVMADFPGWKLRLLGLGESRYLEECRHLVAKLGNGGKEAGNGRIEFAGFCEDMAFEYERCAFVAFPSVDEGFGLVIADAAAFAKPCVMVEDWIGTAKGESENAVAAAGGILTRPTVEAYADGLARLMADAALRWRMGEAARKFCACNYSREKILDKWENLLRNMSH